MARAAVKAMVNGAAVEVTKDDPASLTLPTSDAEVALRDIRKLLDRAFMAGKRMGGHSGADPFNGTVFQDEVRAVVESYEMRQRAKVPR